MPVQAPADKRFRRAHVSPTRKRVWLAPRSWTFIAQGVVFTCSGVFQGLGNTLPAMLSDVERNAIPDGRRSAARPEFTTGAVWWPSGAAT